MSPVPKPAEVGRWSACATWRAPGVRPGGRWAALLCAVCVVASLLSLPGVARGEGNISGEPGPWWWKDHVTVRALSSASGDVTVGLAATAPDALAATGWVVPSGHTVRADASLPQGLLSTALVASDTVRGPPTDGTLSWLYASAPSTGLVAAGLTLRQAPPPELWHHTDHLGSTRVASDNQGRTIGTATYAPYGNLAGATGVLDPATAASDPGVQAGTVATSRFGFAGQVVDTDTGLVYMRARYYDPATSQFLTRDPLVESTHDPYSYAWNNPLANTDPSGLCPPCLAVVGAAVISGGIDLGIQVGFNLLLGCPAFHDISWGSVAASAAAGGFFKAYQLVRAANELRVAANGETELVQRWMSRAELDATIDTGLVRGGRDGTHYVTDFANHNALRARQRLALPQTGEVRVQLEVPRGAFSTPKRVGPDYFMPGGGMERTATGAVPCRVVCVWD